MRKVYNVWGLGFGDDENQWELCATYSRRCDADEARAQILRSSGLDAGYVKVVDTPVQTHYAYDTRATLQRLQQC